MLLLVEVIDQSDGSLEGALSLLSLVLHHGGRLATDKTNLVLIGLLGCSLSKGTSEDVSVFLCWEVHIIVPMWVRILSWIISVILPGRVASKTLWMTVVPGLNIKITYRSALVVVRDSHGSLVGLIIDGLSSEHPLSLLSKSFKNVIWADLHNRDSLTQTSFLTLLSRA